MFRVLRPYQAVIDVTVAAFFFLVAVAFASDAAGQVLAVTLSVSLLLRRFSPGVALTVAWCGAIGQMYFARLQPTIVDLAILAVVYSTAAYGGKIVKWAGLVSVGVGAVLGTVFLSFGGDAYVFGLTFGSNSIPDLAQTALQFTFLLVAMLVLLGLPWTTGLLVRTRIAARISRGAQLEAQREAETAERDVIVEQERNRIARDMHDVVAHSLAVVIAQADGARYARATDPTAVDEALTTISATAREALADVRLLLSQLRHDQAQGPQPAIADIGPLIDQLRASGLRIRDTIDGTPLALGTGQQLAVYRIVQEALTNVLRHGNTQEDTIVHFDWTHRDLKVTITSALVASPQTGELKLGHGLAGMKERATLAGGWLTATPVGRTFVVAASVPGVGVGAGAGVGAAGAAGVRP